DDPNAATPRFRQHGIHPLVEARIESGVRVRRLRLLRQRDGPLRQALEDEDVEIAALDELDCGLDAIARVSCPAADAKRPCGHNGNTRKITAAIVIAIDAAKSRGAV